MKGIEMTPFETFKVRLADKGFRLLLQWEVKREQGVFAFYTIRSEGRQPLVPNIAVFHWPDGGYDSYFPPIVNAIEGDLAMIDDGEAWPVLDDPKCECADCDWTGPQSELNELVDVLERVGAGEAMPAGECPECGAVAHLADAQAKA